MYRYVFLLMTALFLPIMNAQADVAELSAKLGSGDAPAMIEARQLLAYEDPVEVARACAPLLAHENEQIWRAAWNVLRDAGAVAGKPGQDPALLTGVTDAVIALLAPAQPYEVKERTLRLLGEMTPTNDNVQAIADLLQDEALRERARTTLVAIGSTRARTALQMALSQADDGFRVALVDGLTALGDPAALPTLLRYHESASGDLAAALARAIGRLGTASDGATLRALYDRSEGNTQVDIARGWLMLLERVAQAGGHWQWMMDQYAWLLEHGPHPVIQSGAITGLGRFGDERAVDRILTALQANETGTLAGAALEAFRHLPSRAERNYLAARIQEAPTSIQARVMTLFGDDKSGAFAPLLLEGADAADSEVRHAALRSLAAMDHPETLPRLTAALAAEDEATRDIALESIEVTAKGAEQRGQRDVAGEAWRLLYEHRTEEEARASALEGIKRNPTPQAASILLAHLDGNELGGMPVATSLELLGMLEAEERQEEAKTLLASILRQLNNTDATQTFLNHVHNTGSAEAWVNQLGFVRHFHVVGPFPWTLESGFSLDALGGAAIDLEGAVETENGALDWKAVHSGALPALIDLMGHIGEVNQSSAYALARITVEADTEATARIGSDDGFKLWVNGEAAGENLVDRGSAVDQDSVPIQLKAGANELLLQITQGAGGWNFMLRLTGPEGAPLSFSQP